MISSDRRIDDGLDGADIGLRMLEWIWPLMFVWISEMAGVK